MNRLIKALLLIIAISLVALLATGCKLGIFTGKESPGPEESKGQPSTNAPIHTDNVANNKLDPDIESSLEPTVEPTPTPEPSWDDLVKGSPVYVTLLRDQDFYVSQYKTDKVHGTIKAGTVVINWGQGINLDMCNIEYEGKRGYVPYDALEIPEDPETNPNRLTKEQLEEYANEVGKFESETNYYIWTDIDRQLTYIFEGGTGNWSLKYAWECATGTNFSPTTRGHYTISARGSWFFTERLNSGLKWWTRFNGGYVFHSVTYTKDKKLLDDRLGVRASAGCVRLATENAKWIYDNIPRNTGVWIH